MQVGTTHYYSRCVWFKAVCMGGSGLLHLFCFSTCCSWFWWCLWWLWWWLSRILHWVCWVTGGLEQSQTCSESLRFKEWQSAGRIGYPVLVSTWRCFRLSPKISEVCEERFQFSSGPQVTWWHQAARQKKALDCPSCLIPYILTSPDEVFASITLIWHIDRLLSSTFCALCVEHSCLFWRDLIFPDVVINVAGNMDTERDLDAGT